MKQNRYFTFFLLVGVSLAVLVPIEPALAQVNRGVFNVFMNFVAFILVVIEIIIAVTATIAANIGIDKIGAGVSVFQSLAIPILSSFMGFLVPLMFSHAYNEYQNSMLDFVIILNGGIFGGSFICALINYKFD